ncbi:phosphate acetyltransferase [Entomomonas asaccharolytica]|uniref:Phosphate acetyltransferase n=1 Tax=Entomomonas asaccharolytica TaxID=2785331 RepID=A0A974NGX1_9GAMM|nr:phosphate acetyltransferase [Entomomonas asaccharolytica]QQP86259.1 phosphate acetyltransferase [Entomomonas asaccharolytica]
MHAFFVTSTNFGVGLTSISLGLIRALENKGLKVGFCKPIAQHHDREQLPDYSSELIEKTVGIKSPKPLSRNYVEQRLSNDQLDILLEDAINLFQQASIDKDVIVIEGMVPTLQSNYATFINAALAKSLNADIIMVAAPEEEHETTEEFIDAIEIQAHAFGGPRNKKLIGVILNKIKALEGPDAFKEHLQNAAPQLFKDDFKILGCNPWREELNAPRLQDIAKQLNAQIINKGELDTRRVHKIVLCARAVPDTIPLFEPGVLIVTPGDRDDIIMATSLAAMNGIPLAGLILCSNFEPDKRIMTLCKAALEGGLPVLSVKTGSYDTATNLSHIDKSIAVDDQDRAKQVTEFIAEQLDEEWLFQRCGVIQEARLSPPAFRYQLVKRAQEANKRIVLPEGNEPRTIQAAIICHQRNIARCVLLAKPEEVNNVAKGLGLQLPDSLEIIDPDSIRQNYVAPLVELRKNKGMTPLIAEQSLGDSVVLGTMMLATDDVDGLVSGAVNTTANTVRPALQLIKTSPEYNLVSSVFFMLLPDQVLVYGDCAINPDPSAEQLADIAIQSAESAAAFGITPRVAMISYSTGSSGGGEDVEKVRLATELAKQKRPDLLIDGPLQYDAAAIESVGKQKAPDSLVAGKATVFIFPDLNTGNTTYKAVQRSAQVISVGPMLQGLRKPVNDLSRGALVEDIVFTIALTAIQANSKK